MRPHDVSRRTQSPQLPDSRSEPSRNRKSQSKVFRDDMPEPGLEVLGERLGNWKVLLSRKALKSFQSLGRTGHIEEGLRDLASGAWTYSLAGTEQQNKRLRVPLAATRCTAAIWILWQVDVALDETTQAKSQLVRIWEIGTATDISQSIDAVIVLQRCYSQDHISQCRQRPSKDVDKRCIPTLFTEGQDGPESDERDQSLDIRTVEREILEIANRFYVLTEPMIRSILANDLLAEYPFDFSSEEMRIILHLRTSSLILGRSGTGKTTCLVFKLLVKHRASSAVNQAPPPKQLLLTRSNELASKLKHYIDRLIKAFVATPASDDQHLEGGPPLPRDDDDCEYADTIFELRQQSFPLVCTFDRLLELVENTVKMVDQNGFPRSDDDSEDGSDDSDPDDIHDEEQLEPLEEKPPTWRLSAKDGVPEYIDFQAFKLDYWPRFPPALIKNLPVELAFAEIMGVIKGSSSSLDTLQPLLRNDYLNLSSRLAPNFSLESEKLRIYDIFEKYQALKVHRSESDGVDRVIGAISELRKDKRLRECLNAMFDEIYVDEVQDLRCLDLEFLLSIVNDGRAFHFAGDTAQTISQDSHFRFQDVKALMYHHFAVAASVANQSELARPQLFTLMKNYRSHQGILGIASLVMDMLWNAFPETVDKLSPEVGQIHGPIPVFFLGCDTRMLASSDSDIANQPKETLDFGAEQVILVRDKDTKLRLQAELQESALILTILQSKGMEFEDVILWDFFTTSPYAGGWRCLDALTSKSGNFDNKKHAGMCSELKHFYVAITRARIRLSIIETEEGLATGVAESLRRSESSPLVEVTRSSDPAFLKELTSLRSISQDPASWSARGQELMQRSQYEDAAICFRRAKNKRGETCATAYIFEEKGRRLASTEDIRTARECFRQAVQKFVELNMIAEAVRNLERIKEFAEAAWLWAQHTKPGKAAPLFVKAGMFAEASDHYHQALNYDSAAEVLRQGNLGEDLVYYVTTHQERLSQKTFRSLSRFCILLLKKEKLGSKFRTLAIGLLGSPLEQEQAFIRYEMHDQLADLYSKQQRFKDRLLLFVEIGRLGCAMKALKDLTNGDTEDLQSTVTKVENHYFAGQIVDPGFDRTSPPAHSRSAESGWMNALQLSRRKGRQNIFKQTEAMSNGIAKTFLQFHALLNLTPFEDASAVNEIPFEVAGAAIRMAEIVSVDIGRIREPLVILLAGVMELHREIKPFILLPWSPLHENATRVSANEYPRLANEWFLHQLGSSILELDEVLKQLWKLEWPVRCAHFLVRGFCDGMKDRTCERLHRKVTTADCERKVSSLIDINAIFCGLTSIHRKRLVRNRFQETFTKFRRSWLEMLLREMAFVSSFENSSRVIVDAQLQIFRRGKNGTQARRLMILAANIEDLLFHRLGKDWQEKNDFSSLLEQIQVSQYFDYNVQSRFARSLFYRLRQTTSVEYQQHHLRQLEHLEHMTMRQDAPTFRACLQQFLLRLPTAPNVMQFSSFHSITTVFEFFATYLIFRSCRDAVLIPQSWIDMHLAWFTDAGQCLFMKEISTSETQIYASGLLDLINCFCQILAALCSLPIPGFRQGHSAYPTRLLHRRNTELLAIAIANIGLSNNRLAGFQEMRGVAWQTCSLPHIKRSYLQSNTNPELIRKLVESCSAYEGKDCMILVRKTNRFFAAEDELSKLGIRSVPLTQLISVTVATREVSSTQRTDEKEEQQSRIEDAVVRIQQFWRSRYRVLLARRAFLKTPRGSLTIRFTEMCQRNLAPEPIQNFLARDGIEVHENLWMMTSRANDLQQRAIGLLENLPEKDFERLDAAIRTLSGARESLEAVGKALSMERVEELVERDMIEMRRLFGKARSVIREVKAELTAAEQML